MSCLFWILRWHNLRDTKICIQLYVILTTTVLTSTVQNVHIQRIATQIYVGESKIIRTIGTCFAVGYTTGWAWQSTHGLLLSYHCGAGVTLIVHFCHEFLCHKHGHSQFNLHQRRAEGSDPFLWAEGAPGVEMHRMMSVQYGNSVMSQRIIC